MWLSLGTNSLSYAKKVVVLITGGTVLLVGMVMIVTPGPALLVIPAGLAILAIEFVWARRLLKRTRDYVTTKVAAAQARGTPPASPTPGKHPPCSP